MKRKEKEEAKAKAMEQKLIEQELDDAAEIAGEVMSSLFGGLITELC